MSTVLAREIKRIEPRMRILVADTHSIFRIGLRQVLSELRPDIELIETDSVDGAVTILDTDPAIDVLLIDLASPGMNGGAGLKRMMSVNESLPIVVTGADANRMNAMRMIDRGAMGLIAKSVTGPEILEVLDAVLDGRLWLPREALAQDGVIRESVGSRLEPEQVERLNRLTRRQREVLIQLVDGKSNANIARALGLAEGTVRINVSSILKSLNVSNRTQAAILAAQYFEG